MHEGYSKDTIIHYKGPKYTKAYNAFPAPLRNNGYIVVFTWTLCRVQEVRWYLPVMIRGISKNVYPFSPALCPSR